MLAKMMTLLGLLGLATTTVGWAACNGADPKVTNVSVKDVSSDGNLNHYQITGTVVNLGSQAQPSNTLQFVDIFMDSDKVDTKGIPPLKPGESYTFTYVSKRSADAANGTTPMRFVIDEVNRSTYLDCDAAADSFAFTF